MKKIIYTFVILFLCAKIYAQAPESFKYQAVVRDASGVVIANQTIGMRVSILQGSVNGGAQYVETHTATTNEFGLINLEIGKGTVFSGDFSEIAWSSDSYFIKIEIDASGGTSYTEMGTSQLLSVPYALHAKTAEVFYKGSYFDLYNRPTALSDFTNDAGYLVGPETDPVFNSSIASGITGTDTAYWNNKSEFDGMYSSLEGKPGITDTIMAVLDTTVKFLRTELDGDASNELQTISRSGTLVTLSKGGGTFTDSVNIQDLSAVLAVNNDGDASQIKNIADPTDDQDAATKAYVDALEARLNLLLSSLKPFAYRSVQHMLDVGITPYEIYRMDNSLIDSLYGKSYEGGLIFYLNTSDGSGLVSASSDQSTSATWGCQGTIIPGADGSAVGTGAQNTIDIEAGCTTAGTAADICANLSLNGYDDWFLPSRDELILMYTNLYLNGYGDFTFTAWTNYYWTSTEYDSINAEVRWDNSLLIGITLSIKGSNARVRAVRAF